VGVLSLDIFAIGKDKRELGYPNFLGLPPKPLFTPDFTNRFTDYLCIFDFLVKMNDSITTSENSFSDDSADLELNLNNYRKRKRSLIDEMDQTNLQMQLIKDKCDLVINKYIFK